MTEHIPESPHSTTTAGPTRVFDDETSRDDGLRRIFFCLLLADGHRSKRRRGPYGIIGKRKKHDIMY